MLRENKRRGWPLLGCGDVLQRNFPKPWGWVWWFQCWSVPFSGMKVSSSTLKWQALSYPYDFISDTVNKGSGAEFGMLSLVVLRDCSVYLQYLLHVPLQSLWEVSAGFSFHACLRRDASSTVGLTLSYEFSACVTGLQTFLIMYPVSKTYY